ncbi:MAG: pyridoxamine 5'-phosphate oxidase family protein, partial [Actinomycetota bacterium]
MYETPDDLDRMQALLEESYANAGAHLLSIHTPNWRMSAEAIVETLQGMCILNLATVNSKGEPVVGAVDGLFYRGRFYFGSGRDSMRAKHIRRNPAVSASHTRGVELAVTIHGLAVELDKSSPESKRFGEYVAEVYGEYNPWDG